MPVRLCDATEVGEKLTRFGRVQHVRQLAGNHPHVGAHARPKGVVCSVHDDAEDLWRDVRCPPMHAVNRSFAFGPFQRLIRRLQNRDKQQRDLVDSVGEETEAQWGSGRGTLINIGRAVLRNRLRCPRCIHGTAAKDHAYRGG